MKALVLHLKLCWAALALGEAEQRRALQKRPASSLHILRKEARVDAAARSKPPASTTLEIQEFLHTRFTPAHCATTGSTRKRSRLIQSNRPACLIQSGTCTLLFHKLDKGQSRRTCEVGLLGDKASPKHHHTREAPAVSDCLKRRPSESAGLQAAHGEVPNSGSGH